MVVCFIWPGFMVWRLVCIFLSLSTWVLRNKFYDSDTLRVTPDDDSVALLIASLFCQTSHQICFWSNQIFRKNNYFRSVTFSDANWVSAHWHTRIILDGHVVRALTAVTLRFPLRTMYVRDLGWLVCLAVVVRASRSKVTRVNKRS